VSKLGTPFHRFPALIYVNGKFYSELEYKKFVLGWSITKIEEPQKPKRALIDPMSRPRKFYFNYKTETVGDSMRPSQIMDEHGDANGMTVKEAIKKITKQMMRYGWYKRVFDFDLQRIYAWNGAPLWKKEN
jgi:hypothetical protein